MTVPPGVLTWTEFFIGMGAFTLLYFLWWWRK